MVIYNESLGGGEGGRCAIQRKSIKLRGLAIGEFQNDVII